MITVDEIIKLLLGFSVSFAIVMVSFNVSRLFGSVADLVKDLRKTAANLGEGSDMVLEDYRKLRKVVDLVAGFADNFSKLGSILKLFNPDRAKPPREE